MAPALKGPGERAKTNRRDLVRVREAAADEPRRTGRQLLSSLLSPPGVQRRWPTGRWHCRCSAQQGFDHFAQQIVFQGRPTRVLEQQPVVIVPT